jgi:hypothetical protein
MSKIKKTIISVVVITSLLIITLIIFISPIAKYLVEKYDEEFTGRNIEMSWAYLNPFTGYIHFENIKIMEKDSDVIFLSAKGLSADFSMFKLINKTYEISEITLNEPLIFIIQEDKHFNFSDLIEKFSPDSNKVDSPPVHFNMLNIKIKNGEIHYDDIKTPISFFIKEVNIDSDGLRWDTDSIPINYAFSSGEKSGKVAGNLDIDISNLNYNLNIKVDSFDLDIINQYLKDLTNYGTFRAMLDAEMHSTGNFLTVDSLATSGNITLSEFHYGKNKSDDFARFDKLIIAIRDVNPKNFTYEYDSISLQKLYFQYERYDTLDNIQTMFGVGGSNVSDVNANPDKFNLVIEIAKIIDQISRNFFRSQYKIDRFGVYDANINYSDYTLGEKFSVNLNPLNISSDSIDRRHKRVNVTLKSFIKPYGDLYVDLSINPQDSTYFDLSYHFNKIPLTMFNPYSLQFTSFPMDRGSLEIYGKWNVVGGEINSNNHLIIIDPRVALKVKNDDNHWLPLNFAMAIVREKGNVIDYEIPIKGNLKNPKFNVKDIILDILRNIVAKTVSIPYRIEVKKIEMKLEKSLRINWEMLSSELTSSQEEFIDKIVEFLKENPSAKINIKPRFYTIKEKEHILLFEAKKKYYLSINENKKFTSKDSVEVIRMSIKEPKFIKYLDKMVKDSTIFTVQHKAEKLIDKKTIENKINTLNANRKTIFLAQFEKNKVQNQVVFNTIKNSIPFNGNSYYSISYNGDFPDYLKYAFEKMDKLNHSVPREKYFEKRKRRNLIN